jgi:nucleoside-diphosphate-sugar epimerase
METDAALGELFLIGGPKAITTNELIEGFCTAMGVSTSITRIPYWLGKTMASVIESLCSLTKIEPPLSRRTLEFFDTNNAFDITKAKKLLGFEPKFSLVDGLKDCLTWLRGNAG